MFIICITNMFNYTQIDGSNMCISSNTDLTNSNPVQSMNLGN